MSEATVSLHEGSRGETAKGPTPNGRDKGGKFTLGNKLSEGNRAIAKRQNDYRRAALHAASPEDIFEIMRGHVLRAKEGDVESTKIVLPYLIGTPQTFNDDPSMRASQVSVFIFPRDDDEPLPKLVANTANGHAGNGPAVRMT